MLIRCACVSIEFAKIRVEKENSRGGDGAIREIETLAPALMSLLSDRRKRAPYGLEVVAMASADELSSFAAMEAKN